MFYFKAFEGKVEATERRICYAIIAYGVIGGTMSATVALLSMVKQ